MELAVIILLVIVAVVAVSCIHIVPQAKAYVVERLGGYQSTWDVGFISKCHLSTVLPER